MTSAHGNPRHPRWRVPIDAFAASRVGAALFRRTLHYIDRPLMRLTRGRLHAGWGMPFGMLTTTGAQTGRRRDVPLIFTRYGQAYAVIGTRWGSSRVPGWSRNLERHPDAEVLFRGERFRVRARSATPAERDEIWPEAEFVYPGYRVYRERIRAREIPVYLLERVAGHAP